MGRNYQNELKWQKEKYDFIRGAIPKNLGIALRNKLKEKNISIAEWIRYNAEKFINE